MDKTTILKGDGALIKTPDGYMVVGEAIKQVLIYDGELTAEEILAENEKEISLKKPYLEYTVSRDESLETTEIQYSEVE